MISPQHSHCPKELSGDQDYVSHPRVQQPRKVRFETSHHPTCTLQCSKCSPEALSPVLIQKRQPPVAERLTDEMRINILATQRLTVFRKSLRKAADEIKFGNAARAAFLP